MKDPKLYRVVRPALAFLFKLIYRPTTVGAENIPKEGKIVLAGNHTHVLNCFSVGLATKRCVRFIAKAELMKGIGKHIFPGLGIIPLDRSTNGKDAVTSAEKCLDEGNIIAIFPEGTVNRTDKPMLPFKGGAVKIAADAGCDLLFRLLVEQEYLVGLQGEGDSSVSGIDLVIRINDSTDNGIHRSGMVADHTGVATHNFHIVQLAVQGAIVIQLEAFGTDADDNFLIRKIMKTVKYCRIDGKNILTMVKIID